MECGVVELVLWRDDLEISFENRVVDSGNHFVHDLMSPLGVSFRLTVPVFCMFFPSLFTFARPVNFGVLYVCHYSEVCGARSFLLGVETMTKAAQSHSNGLQL